MDYQRKMRWVNYHSSKCKLYLRNDFEFQCAYCRMKEDDAGVVAENAFEKDHFFPKSKFPKIQDSHNYTNMVYSCRKCNNTKKDKDIELLLDPCKDDIYSGLAPHVIQQGKKENYELKPTTVQGKQFIDSLKLNTHYYCQMRRKQAEIAEQRQNLKELYGKLKEYPIPKELLKNMAIHMEIGENFVTQDKDEMCCGVSSAGEAFRNVLEILRSNHIEYELLMESYDVDIKICYKTIICLCEIVINSNSEKPVENRRFNKEKLTYWAKLDGVYGELYYYEKNGRLELYIFNKDTTVNRKECIVF